MHTVQCVVVLPLIMFAMELSSFAMLEDLLSLSFDELVSTNALNSDITVSAASLINLVKEIQGLKRLRI